MLARLNARLRRLEAQTMTSDLPAGQGLAALLDYARRHPPAEPCDPAQLAMTSVGRLLLEARQVQDETEG